MRKFLLILAAAAALFGLASCGSMLDMNDNYIISFETMGHIENEEDADAIKAYFEENYLKESDVVTFNGSYSDAVTKAMDFFETRRQDVDGQFILSHINDPDDIIYLICVISGGKTKEAVASVYWDYKLKQELDTVTE